MNIADTIRTAHTQGAHRPFHKIAMTKKPAKLTDPATLEICNDPVPMCRASSGNKYEAKLKALKLGQAIKCAPGEIGRVSGAMRKFIEVKKLDAVVRSMKDYGDGKGRVWMLAKKEGKA